ncbi:MAG: EpsG family protein [Erysipelothrix sp.]|nr:EpsG family protein [Erysipelothrix sp.]
MNTWILLIILIIFLKVITDYLKVKDKDKTFLILTGVLIVIFFGLRNGEIRYGSDLNNYYRTYIDAIHLDWNVYFRLYSDDFGFYLLVRILASLIPDPQFMFFAMGFFLIYPTFRFIYKYSRNAFISVLVFMSSGLFIFFLSGFRQSLALVIILYSLDFILKRKFIEFLILILIAFSFHQSAIVFLPMYLILNVKMTTIKVIVSTLSLMFLTIYTDYLLNIGNNFFDRSFERIGSQSVLGGFINITMNVFVLVIVFFVLRHKKSWKLNKTEHAFLFMLLIGTGIYFLRFQALVFERISLYFTSVLIVLLPYAIFNLKPQGRTKLIFYFSVFLLVMLFAWRISSPNLKYVFFWET